MSENLNLNEDEEIKKALEEFEVKSSAEQIKKAPVDNKTPDAPKMVGWVMKWSGVKEERQAEYILLGFVIIMIAVSLYLFFGKNLINSSSQVPESEIIINM
ncbi:MAG: hypothetical protein WC870_02175 [Candidatus Paceibacterota bacterium]